MGKERETDKLKVEDLENRVAPISIIYTEPPTEDPGGGGGGGTTQVMPDQPGNSDEHRDKLFHQNQE